MLVGVVFLILNKLFFHLKAADATIGALNSLYLNSNNIGLPIATYILGNPALVAPILVMQQAVFTPIGLTVLDVTTKGKVSARRSSSSHCTNHCSSARCWASQYPPFPRRSAGSWCRAASTIRST